MFNYSGGSVSGMLALGLVKGSKGLKFICYRYLLKSCPVCLIACKPSGKGFLEVVPFKPLHGDSPHPTYRPKDLDILCLAAFRWCLCCGG